MPKAKKVESEAVASAALPPSQWEPSKLVARIEGPGIKLDAFPSGSKAYRQAVYLVEQLEKEGHVRLVIQLGEKEKRGLAVETVIVNSLRFNILKGVFVNLPPDVAKIIEDAFYGTNAALNDTQVVNPVTGAVHSARVDMRSDDDQGALT